jgi:XapX domain-containing protein
MKIAAAFIIALATGAISRWARIPSLAPQAIVGSFLIVAMTAGCALTDRCLVAQASLKVSSISVSRSSALELFQTSDGISGRREPIAGTTGTLDQQWRFQVESLQSLVAELLAANECLRQRLHDHELRP